MRAPRTEQGRPSHSSRASSNSGIKLATRNTGLSASLTCRAQGDIMFQVYISSLTIRDSMPCRRRNMAADVF